LGNDKNNSIVGSMAIIDQMTKFFWAALKTISDCPKNFNCHNHDQENLVTQVANQKLVIDFFGHCSKKSKH
jgi:hypothetical protein